MDGHHDRHSPFNYSGHGSPRRSYSYLPRAWRQSRPMQVVVEKKARAEEAEAREADIAMRTAMYVGVGALGFIGVGALIYMIARK